MPNSYLFTSESVSEGHPDKVADRLSDTILDAYLAHDKHARVASEVLVTDNLVVLAGEQRADFQPDYEALVRAAIKDIGYTADVQTDFSDTTVKILNHMNTQSAEIAQGVDAGDKGTDGAGDQGIMFGYACNETEELMPAAIHYSHQVLKNLSDKRKAGLKELKPDAKSQLTLEYVDGKPTRVHTALVSHQHQENLSRDALTDIVKEALQETLPEGWMDKNTRILVNPTGSFVKGGPAGDTGLTGRKIIVDTYGGAARHGGGAFSGKDPTKVDRSAAYAARYLAKNVVASGLAHRCEIQLCYAIGVPEPLAIYVDTFGTAQQGLTDLEISNKLMKSMDLTPRGIREHLGLAAPIYVPTSSYGHFGRKELPWEKINLSLS